MEAHTSPFHLKKTKHFLVVMKKLLGTSLLTTILLSTFALHEAFISYQLFTRSLATGSPASRGTSLLRGQPNDHTSKGDYCTNNSESELKDTSQIRRLFASQIVGITGALYFLPSVVLAGIDVSSLKSVPVDGDVSGAVGRLKQLQMQGTKIERGENFATITRLDSGVTYRDINTGRDGARTVRRGSNVGAEMTIRCKSLATASEPEGVKYFSTKEDNNTSELSWTIGSGDFPKGLEEGMLGMKLNAVRRIEVPSRQIFAARNAGQLPEATTEEGKRRYASLFQSDDSTLVFEVFLTGVNQGDNRI